MKVDGKCPVQGYEIRDGWLFFFRARDGWELMAWRPGQWTGSPDDHIYRFGGQFIGIGELHRGDGLKLGDDEIAWSTFPTTPEGESHYPGWWSSAYASKVAEWAINEILRISTQTTESA